MNRFDDAAIAQAIRPEPAGMHRRRQTRCESPFVSLSGTDFGMNR